MPSRLNVPVMVAAVAEIVTNRSFCTPAPAPVSCTQCSEVIECHVAVEQGLMPSLTEAVVSRLEKLTPETVR